MEGETNERKRPNDSSYCWINHFNFGHGDAIADRESSTATNATSATSSASATKEKCPRARFQYLAADRHRFCRPGGLRLAASQAWGIKNLTRQAKGGEARALASTAPDWPTHG